MVLLTFFSSFTLSLPKIPFFTVALCALATIYGKDSGSSHHYNMYNTFMARSWRFAYIFPLSVVIGLGMSVFETYAVIDGLVSITANFCFEFMIPSNQSAHLYTTHKFSTFRLQTTPLSSARQRKAPQSSIVRIHPKRRYQSLIL